MADEHVGFRSRRHGRQLFQELQRLEHPLPRAIVPGSLQLQRDPPVGVWQILLGPEGHLGLSIVLVEQSAELMFDAAEDIVVLNSGRVVVDGTAAELRRSGVDLRQHLRIY